jgi:hypothetical protein
MAFMIPETIAARPGATAGERKVFVALREHLPEDYLVYYEISVKGRYPDFIVIGPDLGLVVLEVKDWRLGSIAGVTGEGIVLRRESEEIVVPSPIQQARGYVLRAVDTLKRRSLLSEGGRLRFGWGYAAVFTAMTHREIETPSLFGPSLADALGAGVVLTSEDLAAGKLLARLREALPRASTPGEPLNPIQIDEIRGTLYPEIRVGWGLTNEDIMRVMDREQERLARTLGEGHRLLRGVSGSGKTLTLICRAHHLRTRYPQWRILVVCFNRVLADYLRAAIGPDAQVEVVHFHGWCWRQLETAGLTVPPPPTAEDERAAYWDETLPKMLLRAYEEGRCTPGAYQAILVDEGQDFADDWYRALLRALDPDTNSLLIALDSSQNIYKRKVSWRTLGIQVAGRTRVFRVNYRNTWQILSAAYGMIRDLDTAGMAVRETEEEYVVPDRVLRQGVVLEVRRSSSAGAAFRDVLEWIRVRLARGVPPDQIMVLGLSWDELSRLDTWLDDAGVPAQVLGRRGQPGAVRLSTVHSSKGLDAECVLLLGAHRLDRHDETEARRLLYIAMTRARSELCVAYHAESALMNALNDLVTGSRDAG